MTQDKMRAALAGQQAMIDSNEESLETVLRQYEQIERTLGRLTGGEDVRQVLLDEYKAKLATVGEIIRQTREQIEIMKNSSRLIRNAVEG